MDEKQKKTVDQDWKEQVDKEKKTYQQQNQTYHKPDFKIFISSLSMQSMIALGRLENPVTKKTEKNFDQARYLIDTLEIIEAKTKNNLDQEEKKLLEESLFSLRMAYLEEKNKK
ncbi:MAG: DUF1844 domain-containing protein [Candidatus Omnitrophica bacterium]|nr:DUF1844 domain-containing protein [Candidatus Omnitrophota bacterium]MCF7893819.1 DUF1844 domain-containing protein [Candidatus Omnitrophota bacterium]